jgi:hypothetical protein
LHASQPAKIIAIKENEAVYQENKTNPS